MLCDFSVETLMTDEVKWKIRVEEGSCYIFNILLGFLFNKIQLWLAVFNYSFKNQLETDFPIHYVFFFFLGNE